RSRSFRVLRERLEGLGDADVLLVAPLVAFELLSLDRVDARARDSGSTRRARLLFGGSRLELVFGVVRALPREPLGRPRRVRRLEAIAAEWKRPAGRAIERRAVFGKKPARRLRDRLPDEEGARIGVGRRNACREELKELERATALGRRARRGDLACDRDGRPYESAGHDERCDE